MSLDLNNILTRYINKDIYSKFKEDIAKNIVDVVQKEDVVRFMFENVNVPKSSLMKPDGELSRNSLTPNINQRILPAILQYNETRNTNMNNRMNINNNMNKIPTATNNNMNVLNNSINFRQSQENTISNIPNANNTINAINNNNFRPAQESSNINTVTNNNLNSINNIYCPSKEKVMNNTMTNINNINNNYRQIQDTSIASDNNANLNNFMNNNYRQIQETTITNTTTNNINNSINYSQTKETFTISGPFHFSTTNNNNATTTSLNPPVQNNVGSVSTPKSILCNNLNNLNNFAFSQSITECNHESITSTKEEKEKPKFEKNDKMEVEETGDVHPTPSGNSPNMKNKEVKYSQENINEMRANLSDNQYKSPNISKKLISVHLSPSRNEENLESKNVNLLNSYKNAPSTFLKNDSKERVSTEMTSTITKKKIEVESTTTFKNSINNASIFNGKLVDVLNKEKSKNENNEQKEKNEENSQESPIFSNNLAKSNENNTNITSTPSTTDKYVSKKIESTQININSTTSQLVSPVEFMYPVFKSNIIKGAIDKNTVQEIKITFTDFSSEDPILTEFPTGGAYCNHENFLYFTGGQDYIKEAGKLFLSISKKSLSQNAVKLPMMKFCHWNHSMIANKDKIYVIGGYNSNKCEIYDITNKTWSEMPDLIAKERQRSMLFIENNFLYCFMGLSQEGILDTVERINLDNIDAGWENIIVVNSDNLNLKFYGAGIIRMKQANKILFIGGKKENKKKKEITFKRSIFEFSFEDFKMSVSDFKIENDLVFVENKLYSMDEHDCGNFINVGNGFLISMPILEK